MPQRARYDGFAEWYDDYVRGAARDLTQAVDELLHNLLGRGRGRCLDLGCGTGIHVPTLASLGWSVVGVELSFDQLRMARERVGGIAEKLVQADAARLPFPDSHFDALVSVFLHTDVDDFLAVLREARRVLKPGRRFVYAGVHPCFGNPFAAVDDEGRIVIRPGYGRRGWYEPGSVRGDVRSRVGVHHLTLADVLNAVLGAGFDLERLEEGGGDTVPALLAWRATAGRSSGPLSKTAAEADACAVTEARAKGQRWVRLADRAVGSTNAIAPDPNK